MTLTRTAFKRAPAKEPKPAKGPRQRKCKCCGASFVPQGLASWCSLPCAHKLAMALLAKQKAKAQRQERAETKAKLVKFKRKADWIKEAQREFNHFIRLRDKDQPCICCGRESTKVDALGAHGWDCGHYRSVGSAPHLRYDLRNLAKQCARCNVHLGGNLINYRIGLVNRYGESFVQELEADQAPKHYTKDDLKA